MTVQTVKDENGMTLWVGPINEVLAAGEYDQGDRCVVSYDALYDLVSELKERRGHQPA